MRTKYIIGLMVLTATLAGCREVPTYEVGAPKGDSLQEKMIGANRLIAQSEESQIDAYLQRRGWQLDRLADGVRVSEMGNGETALGHKITADDTVDMAYSVLTLGGDTIYSHRTERVVAGRLKPTRGLDAALQTLHEGATALVIVPSEQAYGVVGDGEKIGSRMVLVYEVSEISVKR